MKRIIPILILAVTIFAFTGCGANEVKLEDVTGTWTRTMSDGTETLVLNSDMTYSKSIALDSGIGSNTNDTFTLDGDEISITYSEFNKVSKYKVTVDGDTMTWDNGDAQLEYKKK